MLKLKSMKMKAKDKKADMGEIEEYKEPEYPWGLSIELRDGAIKDLGISGMKAGDEVSIVAKATVRSVSSSEVEAGKGTISRENMSLQITDMAVEQPSSDKAASMFPTMNEKKG